MMYVLNSKIDEHTLFKKSCQTLIYEIKKRPEIQKKKLLFCKLSSKNHLFHLHIGSLCTSWLIIAADSAKELSQSNNSMHFIPDLMCVINILVLGTRLALTLRIILKCEWISVSASFMKKRWQKAVGFSETEKKIFYWNCVLQNAQSKQTYLYWLKSRNVFYLLESTPIQTHTGSIQSEWLVKTD